MSVMVTQAAYTAAGGHAAEPGPASVSTTSAARRSVKASGHPIALRNGTELVHTPVVVHGLPARSGSGLSSKNVYGGIGYRPGMGLLTLFVVVPALLIPFLRLGAGLTAVGRSVPGGAGRRMILSMRAVASHASGTRAR